MQVSEAVGVSIVTAIIGPAFMAILAAILNRKIKHIRSDTAQTLNQVQNDHPANMREEGDERHDEIVALVSAVLTTQTAQGHDIGGIRSELRTLRRDDGEQRGRILDLEKTKYPKETP